MKIEIKNAEINNLDEINNLLRLSKAHWGYDENFSTNSWRSLALLLIVLKKPPHYFFGPTQI